MPLPRELTDGYRLERILASSRCASVLGGHELATGRPVVIKLINVPSAASAAAAESAATRFVAYAEALARLRHPNLPVILDSGLTPDGGAFLVMEPLSGFSFDTLARRGDAGGGAGGGDDALALLPDLSDTGSSSEAAPERTLPLLDQAAAGLAELAGNGLAHFNVSPGNLFVAETPQGSQIKLLGLGTPLFYLGRAWLDAETGRYRAPELAKPAAAMALSPAAAGTGFALADWHADCFSLALTVCNALGATVAFGDPSGPIVQMPLALSFELANDEALRRILELCLRPLPPQRPAHAAIRDAFRLALGRETGATAPPPTQAARAPAPPPAQTRQPPAAPAAQPAPPRPAAQPPQAAPGSPPAAAAMPAAATPAIGAPNANLAAAAAVAAAAAAGEPLDWRAALSRSQAPAAQGPAWLPEDAPPPPPAPGRITGALAIPPPAPRPGTAATPTLGAAPAPPAARSGTGAMPIPDALPASPVARSGTGAMPIPDTLPAPRSTYPGTGALPSQDVAPAPRSAHAGTGALPIPDVSPAPAAVRPGTGALPIPNAAPPATRPGSGTSPLRDTTPPVPAAAQPDWGLAAGDDDPLFLDGFHVPATLPSIPDSPDGASIDLLSPAPPAGSGGSLSAQQMAAELGIDLGGAKDGPGQAAAPAAASAWDAALPGLASAALPAAAAAGAAGRTSLPVPSAMPAAAIPPATGRSAPAAGAKANPAPAAMPAGSAKPAGSPGTGATAAAAAAPAPAGGPAATPAPAGGDALSAVDDLLDSLPPPPPAAAPAPAATRGARSAGAISGSMPVLAAGQRGGRAAAAPPAGGPAALAMLRELPKAVQLGGAAAVVLILAVAAWAVFSHRSHAAAGSRQDTAADGTALGAAAAPVRLGPTPAAKLAEASSYQIMGRDYDAKVRQGLHELTFADQGELGGEGCRQLAAIEQTLAADALERVPQDLASGLHNGDLGTLQTVVEVAGPHDVPPNQAGDFEKARNLVQLYEAAQAANGRGDYGEVLDRFHAMEGLSRTLHDPLGLRDKAATAVEAAAAALARDGKYDQAVGQLEPVRRSWPERGGVKELVKTYESAGASEQQQQAILDSVPSFERRRKPSEGLDLLRPLKPTPHLEARVNQARQELEAQLAQLDAQPPAVALRDGYLLDYSRGQVVTLSFRVTDDYEVRSVKLYARPQGGAMRELPLQKDGLGYSVDIPPSFHENNTVEFYVVATDLSGHQGMLGSKEKPLQLKRRQGFERLLQ